MTTWSSHNQHLPLNHTKSRRQLTDAEKATMKVHKTCLQAKRNDMEADINKLLEKHARDIEELAKKHSKKPDYIDKIITNRTCYKTPRKVSLHNAIVHHKNQEVNNRALGDRLPLSDIQKLAKDDPQFHDLTEERKKELLEGLEEHRKVNQQGLQASNLSASLDVKATMDRIGLEMDKLSRRTGVRAFAVVAKGHLSDASVPGWLASGDVLDFFPAVVKMSCDDFLSKFEYWSIMQDLDSLKAARADCTAFIMEGLCAITGQTSIKMNYINYDTSIIEMHHVRLVGWPEDIAFGNPSTIPDVGAVRRLRTVLKEGSCKWIKMTERQQQQHNEMLQEKRRAGQVVGVKRKEQSDKGGIHKRWGVSRRREGNEPESERREDDEDEEDDAEEDVVQRPWPQRSTHSKAKSAESKVPPAFKSREFVDDDESAGDRDDDEDYDEDNN
ncbi:hypothetical protein F5887DRAFT_888830 [Amanita rubescens]|nr:hypothetical protein F5887DRAFT_888830 [Amanita rubescens]